MSTGPLDTRVDFTQPDDDDPDTFAMWEADEGELSDEEEASIVALAAKITGGAGTKLAHDVSNELRGEHGRWSRSGAVAKAVAKVKLLASGPTGDFEADNKRVTARQTALLAKGQDTMTVFDKIDGAPGKYTAEREAMHAKVIDHFVNKPGVKSERKMLMLGGLPGAGKTTFLNSEGGKKALGGLNRDEYVDVNPDEVKAYMIANGMVPEYPGLTTGEAATLFHEESTYLSKLVLERAAAQGKNIVYDTSLKDAGQATKATDVLDRNGDHYHRTMLFIDVPVDLAVQRAIYRYEKGDEKRFTPLENIRNQADPSGKHLSMNRHAFEQAKGSADHWILVDNSNADGKGSKVVATGGKST